VQPFLERLCDLGLLYLNSLTGKMYVKKSLTMSVPKHWLLGVWYSRDLIVRQQTDTPSDSNKNLSENKSDIRSCWKLCHMQVVCVAFSKHETPLRVVSLSYFPVFHNIMCLMLIFCRRILRIGFSIHFFVPYIRKHVPYLKKKY
jgi:hypothetical protein